MKKTLSILAMAAIFLSFASCEDEENDLGQAIQNNNTLYNGICDTITADDIVACTLYDDSLLTAGYTNGIVGSIDDPTFGNVNSTIYAQLSLASTTGVDFSNGYTIDSLVLSLAIDQIYPADTACTLHFDIRQLAEPLSADSSYTANSTTPTGEALCDSTVQYTTSQQVVRLKLGGTICQQICRSAYSQSDFNQAIKGLYIALHNSDSRTASGQKAMITVNFANASTMATAYYTYYDEDTKTTDTSTYNFIVGCKALGSDYVHYMHYSHQYNGTPLAALANHETDTLAGSDKLYLEPLGGTSLYINIDKYVKQFHLQHPNAVINYAELLLPVGDNYTQHPSQLVAYKQNASGLMSIITDYNSYTNPYAYSGFDGTYHADLGCYRLRISQHLQEAIRQNGDYGIKIYINERRTTAARAVINGTHASNPTRIAIIYSE